MDASAFASLVSLSEILDTIKRRSFHKLTHVDQHQIDDFLQTVLFLQQFLEKLSPGAWREIETHLAKIPDLAFAARNTIDRHVVDQVTGARDEEPDRGVSAFRQDLSSVVEQMAMIKRELGTLELQSFPSSLHDTSATYSSTSQKSGAAVKCVTGFEERVRQLKKELASNEPRLKSIPIVGMGGIGKTTLARCVYDDRFSVLRFDRRLWCTVSQSYDVRSILQEAVGDKETKEIPDLGHKLHQMLFRCRYLVVLDDVWTIEAWEALKPHFPTGTDQSRVIVTTRKSDLARDLCSSNNPFEMKLLDEDQSWELLRQKVFSGVCPTHLVEVGQGIARRCRGLPMSIVAIAGLLSESKDMTLTYWDYVAENVSSLVSSEDYGNCLNILSFSYENMPLQLKPCFLHLGHYKEGYIIGIDGLIEEWTCAALLKPIDGKTMEETGKEYLKNLVDRNLVLNEPPDYGCKESSRFRIHDLVRELCLTESQKGNMRLSPYSCVWEGRVCAVCSDVTCIAMWRTHSFHTNWETSRCSGSLTHQVRRLNVSWCCYCCSRCIEMEQESSRSASVLPCYCEDETIPNPHFHAMDRVIGFADTHPMISALTCPIPLFLFWNVLFLDDMTHEAASSSAVSSMTELQACSRLDARGDYADLNKGGPGRHGPVKLEKLVMLRSCNLRCTDEMVERAPSLRALDVSYHWKAEEQSWYRLENIGFWRRLRELSLSDLTLENEEITYPDSMEVLKLKRCKISASHTGVLGSLPNLKRLSLISSDLGRQWRIGEAEFPELEYLEVSDCYDLHGWRVKAANFPKLENLVMRNLWSLEKIPLDVGNISTLLGICVAECCDGVVESAKRIFGSQRMNVNDAFHLHVSTHGSLLKEHQWTEEEEEAEDQYEEDFDGEDDDEVEVEVDQEEEREDGETREMDQTLLLWEEVVGELRLMRDETPAKWNGLPRDFLRELEMVELKDRLDMQERQQLEFWEEGRQVEEWRRNSWEARRRNHALWEVRRRNDAFWEARVGWTRCGSVQGASSRSLTYDLKISKM